MEESEDQGHDEILDLDAIREEARRVALEMLAEGGRLRENRRHWLIHLFDGRGRVVLQITLGDAVGR